MLQFKFLKDELLAQTKRNEVVRGLLFNLVLFLFSTILVLEISVLVWLQLICSGHCLGRDYLDWAYLPVRNALF